MNVYISVDLEGIAGVVTPKQAGHRGPAHQMASELMVGETNAAISAAFEAGATRVVVNDSHGSMTNLAPAQLDARALLVTGGSKLNQMMEGIDDTFDAAMFIGYHSRAQSGGVLSHTFIGSIVYELKINGHAVGETELNAGIAGAFGVPVVMVTGDSVLAEEAKAAIPGIEAVAVKYPAGTFAATCLSPEMAREKIKQGVLAALARKDQIKPLRFAEPVTFELTFVKVPMANACELIPGVRRVREMTVACTGQTYIEAFRCFLVMMIVGGDAMR